MSSKSSRRSELPELVPYHVLGNEQLDELPAVVDQEIMADEVGNDCAIARPRLEWLAVARGGLAFDSNEQPVIHVRSLSQ
jgi:hypothetical protein